MPCADSLGVLFSLYVDPLEEELLTENAKDEIDARLMVTF
jgi:hypothetical protein